MNTPIKFRAFSYINTNADRVENYDSLIAPLAENGFEVDLTTERNELLTIELKQESSQAELSLKINGDPLTFAAECEASLTGQEKYNVVISKNIEQIIEAVKARMN